MRGDRFPDLYLQDVRSTDSIIEEDIPPHPLVRLILWLFGLRLIADFTQEFPEEIEKLESHYFALGEVSNVWKCLLKTTNRTASSSARFDPLPPLKKLCILQVAVKAMRGICSDVEVRSKFERVSLEFTFTVHFIQINKMSTRNSRCWWHSGNN